MKKIDLAYIVDDNEFVLTISEKMITNHAAFENIASFTNGLLALNAIQQAIENKSQLPSVIFLDINMPVMNGWEFLNAINNITAAQDIAIYLFTDSREPEDISKAKTYIQVKGFISKKLPKHELDIIAG
jgi:CheY-like chemotaxis protein